MGRMNTLEEIESCFAYHWERNKGREQTDFFACITLEHLPPIFHQILTQYQLSILDWGCALGEAVKRFQDTFPMNYIVGMEVVTSAVTKAKIAYPECHFILGDITTLPETFDVIYASNCLEHFEKPLKILKDLLNKANDYVIILVPFQEYI